MSIIWVLHCTSGSDGQWYKSEDLLDKLADLPEHVSSFKLFFDGSLVPCLDYKTKYALALGPEEDGMYKREHIIAFVESIVQTCPHFCNPKFEEQDNGTVILSVYQ